MAQSSEDGGPVQGGCWTSVVRLVDPSRGSRGTDARHVTGQEQQLLLLFDSSEILALNKRGKVNERTRIRV